MSQQQKNQYVYEYQGYQLTFEGYEKPSELDIQKAYTEALSQQDQQSDPIMSMPYLQVGDVETVEIKEMLKKLIFNQIKFIKMVHFGKDLVKQLLMPYLLLRLVKVNIQKQMNLGKLQLQLVVE